MPVSLYIILDAYLRANFDTNLANHEIIIKGFRGGMVHTMYTALVDVNDFKPDCYFANMK